jgi:hypothetical protein
MDTRKTCAIPPQLEALRRRFELSRRTRRPRSPIPHPLWAAAVKLVGRYGLHRTAKSLRVDYYSLKKRLTATSAAAPDRPAPSMQAWCPVGAQSVSAREPDDGTPTFVELPASMKAGCGECIVELESAAGAKMRVHLKTVAAPDLAALCRSLWNPAP